MTEKRLPYNAERSAKDLCDDRRTGLDWTADILGKIGGVALVGSIAGYLAWAAWAMFNLLIRNHLSSPDIAGLCLLLILIGMFTLIISFFIRRWAEERTMRK